MGNMTGERTGQDGSGGVEGVKERVQDAAEQAKSQTRMQLREQIDTRTTEIGDQFGAASRAVRRAGEQLRTEGNERAANLVETLAERGERLGTYLAGANGDRILRDVEDLTRRQPWLAATAGAVAGFLASRFVKATSGNRYHATSRTQTGSGDGLATGRSQPQQLGRPGSPSVAGGGPSGIH
jgi:hypothetical protein